MLANLPRDRLIIVLTSLAGASLLYLCLFGLVLRASRQLRSQRQDLERQALELGAARRDLTRLEEQLRTSERLAAVGEVSAGVAHGIRNPLANIRASAQLAQVLRDDPDSVDKQLVTITAEVDRLGRWLASLLDVARPFQPRFAPVDVNAMVEDLLPLFAERCAAASIRVERGLAPALPPLTGDRAFLEQALSSVIENALDALHASGTLTVKTATDTLDGRPAVSVVVSDDGEGIPEAARAQIFQPFFTTRTRGTGLGLAVTRKVVEAHGGRVDLASTPGVGTQVRIVLPVGGPPQSGHA
jgi:signal transduction histidine kinase